MLVLLLEVGAGQVVELDACVFDVGSADIEVDADGEAVVVGGGGLETHFDCVGWRLCVCGVVVYEVVVM